MQKNVKTLCFNKYLLGVIILLEIVFTSAIALSWGRTAIDETEHLHMSWLVSTGMIPYRDFFEHHNPLLWYVFAPISALFFNSAYVLYAGHFFSMFVSAAALVYIYKITVRYLASPTAAIIALILYAEFNWMGRITFIEFRPDVFMNFCFWCGLYYYMRYMEQKKVKNLSIAFTMFTLSFLFLQKIILLLFFLGLYTLYRLYIKDFRWIDIIKALMIPTVIISGFVAYLYFNGALNTYFMLNYSLNSILAQYFGLYQMVFWFKTTLLFLPLINGYGASNFDLYSAIGALVTLGFAALIIKQNNKYMILFYLLFVAELILRYFTFSPYYYYFSLIKVFISVIIAGSLCSILPQHIKKFTTICLIFFYTVAGMNDSYISLTQADTLKPYIQKLQFVLDNSDVDDFILNGNKFNFNIYRKDSDYIGFSLNEAGYLYNQHFGNPDYDINKIIIEKKPKLIWMENYVNTPLHERRFRTIRNFNSDLLYLWRKYPNQDYSINDLIINVPIFYTYKMDQELLSRYYEPTGFKKFWILKKDMDKSYNYPYDATD